MVENSKMHRLKNFVNKRVSSKKIQHQGLRNNMDKRKNQSLVELARTTQSDSKLPKYFWADAVSTTCYVSN